MAKSKTGFKKSDFKKTEELADQMQKGDVAKMTDAAKEEFMDNFSKTLLGELGAAVSSFAIKANKAKTAKANKKTVSKKNK